MFSSVMLVLATLGTDDNAVATSELAPGFHVTASGVPIDVEIGHAAPWHADFDGDGIKDLLVGQYGGGKLRIYPNQGTEAQPEFTEFIYFQAGGKDATVPFG